MKNNFFIFQGNRKIKFNYQKRGGNYGWFKILSLKKLKKKIKQNKNKILLGNWQSNPDCPLAQGDLTGGNLIPQPFTTSHPTTALYFKINQLYLIYTFNLYFKKNKKPPNLGRIPPVVILADVTYTFTLPAMESEDHQLKSKRKFHNLLMRPMEGAWKCSPSLTKISMIQKSKHISSVYKA